MVTDSVKDTLPVQNLQKQNMETVLKCKLLKEALYLRQDKPNSPQKVNGSSYSVQPDGPGQERGKTRTRPAKSSSRKTHLEDARTSPHSPRFVPTNFNVNPEPELNEGSALRVEPLSSGSHRNISVPVHKLVQSHKRRGVGNMPKPLAGGHKIPLIHQELSGSGEDHRALRRVEPIVLQSQDQKKELEMTPALEEGPVASISSKPAPETSKEKTKGPQKKNKGTKSHQGKGKGKENWHRPYPQGCRIPKLEPSALDSVFNMARTLMEFIDKEQERMNRTFPHK
ncbi:hypothetical protein O181_124243 [Austropuccinia psidii MF-1]|uniref:Uncharacterized protein n=1 Tax=Austropuccinia psidii MF-1 TaxID=1389203 RepID=A0A9Q3KNA8_9BASI|nr:hypothetical protein [Austropuccinia psidii MF-1]